MYGGDVHKITKKIANFDRDMKNSIATSGQYRQRNSLMSIVKGMAIILMVAGHAEGGDMLVRFIYLFHMPVFFIAAGYFFSQASLDDPWRFCMKRVRGLYFPFVKWAVLFLLLHNVLFYFGILNETYGNWTGGITHPYTVHSFFQRLVHIIFSMAGYDEFMAGAFWFFRALLITSVGYLLLRLLLRHYFPQLDPVRASLIICAGALAFALFKIGCNMRIVTVVQGGIRETWGIFFVSFGVIFRALEHRLPRMRWWNALAIFAFLVVGAWFEWTGMTLTPTVLTVATLPVTGILGFMMLRWLARQIDARPNVVRRLLVTVGEMTMCIFVFHISAFKLVSLVKIWWYGLDFAQIGCHMVIHQYASDDLFWVAYTVVGVAVPVVWKLLYDRLASNVRRIRAAGEYQLR